MLDGGSGPRLHKDTMYTIEQEKNPQTTASTSVPVVMDNPIPGQDTMHEVTTSPGHAWKDQKYDKRGLSPVGLSAGQSPDCCDPYAPMGQKDPS